MDESAKSNVVGIVLVIAVILLAAYFLPTMAGDIGDSDSTNTTTTTTTSTTTTESVSTNEYELVEYQTDFNLSQGETKEFENATENLTLNSVETPETNPVVLDRFVHSENEVTNFSELNGWVRTDLIATDTVYTAIEIDGVSETFRIRKNTERFNELNGQKFITFYEETYTSNASAKFRVEYIPPSEDGTIFFSEQYTQSVGETINLDHTTGSVTVSDIYKSKGTQYVDYTLTLDGMQRTTSISSTGSSGEKVVTFGNETIEVTLNSKSSSSATSTYEYENTEFASVSSGEPTATFEWNTGETFQLNQTEWHNQTVNNTQYNTYLQNISDNPDNAQGSIEYVVNESVEPPETTTTTTETTTTEKDRGPENTSLWQANLVLFAIAVILGAIAFLRE